MELRDYLRRRKGIEKGFTFKKFSQEIGLPQCRLSGILNYQRCPTIKVALDIQRATSNQIKAWDLILSYLSEKKPNLLIGIK